MFKVAEFRCICVVGMLDVGTVFNVGKQKRELFVLIDRYDKVNWEGGTESAPVWVMAFSEVSVTYKTYNLNFNLIKQFSILRQNIKTYAYFQSLNK